MYVFLMYSVYAQYVIYNVLMCIEILASPRMETLEPETASVLYAWLEWSARVVGVIPSSTANLIFWVLTGSERDLRRSSIDGTK